MLDLYGSFINFAAQVHLLDDSISLTHFRPTF